jgi:hypothetical protein
MESCPAKRGKPCRLLDSVLAIEAEAAAPTPAEPVDVPNMSVLTAVLDDAPTEIIESAKGDGEGLAAWIVGKWAEYARLAAARSEDER